MGRKGQGRSRWPLEADEEDTLRVLRHRAPTTRELPPIFEQRFVAELTEPRIEPAQPRPPAPPRGLQRVLRWLSGA